MLFYVCIASKSLSELFPPIGAVLELNLALYVLVIMLCFYIYLFIYIFWLFFLDP